MASGAKKKHVETVVSTTFNRQRAETPILRKNCGNEGYVFTMTTIDGRVIAAGQCQFHHVLPVTSLADPNINLKGEDLDYVHKCMAMTRWDINEQPNMIGLPTKHPFLEADKLSAGKPATKNKPAVAGLALDKLMTLDPTKGMKGNPPNFACHLNDHDRYTDAVVKSLNKILWPKLKEDRIKCKDQAKDIKALLEARSNSWKGYLKARGSKQEGGAAECWINRETTKRSVWFIPLSMAPDYRECLPPPNYYKRGKVKAGDWLDKVFSWKG